MPLICDADLGSILAAVSDRPPAATTLVTPRPMPLIPRGTPSDDNRPPPDDARDSGSDTTMPPTAEDDDDGDDDRGSILAVISGRPPAATTLVKPRPTPLLPRAAPSSIAELYSSMKSATKARIFNSFALSKSNCALGMPAAVLGNLSAMSWIQFSTTPTSRQKQASSGQLASSRTYVRAVDWREFITTHKLLKSEP
jgi:hypothetical protein